MMGFYGSTKLVEAMESSEIIVSKLPLPYGTMLEENLSVLKLTFVSFLG